RVRERDRHLERRGLAAVAEVLDRDALEVEPGAHPEHLAPVPHRGLDVAHDVAVLARLPEDPAHRGRSSSGGRREWNPRRRSRSTPPATSQGACRPAEGAGGGAGLPRAERRDGQPSPPRSARRPCQTASAASTPATASPRHDAAGSGSSIVPTAPAKLVGVGSAGAPFACSASVPSVGSPASERESTEAKSIASATPASTKAGGIS